MTEEEKEALRALKRRTAEELQRGRDEAFRLHREALVETDPRIGQYVEENIARPGRHNLYELLAVRRFLLQLGRHAWDKGRVRHFFRFYETVRFSGLDGRRRYRLTPVQAFQFANIYGLSRRSDGRRLVRTAYIFVPRKFSKTTGSAAMAVYDLLFGDNNAEAYIGANSYDQAKKCFNEVRAIMLDIDPRQRHFRINRELINFRDRGRDSLVQCLTANARTKDGLFASLAILDEYAQARNTPGRSGADLKNVLTSSMGPRRESLAVIITTASDVTDGPCYAELEGVKAVLRGEAENETVFASLFLPDVDDEEGDPATWAKVQPHLGITVQPDYYEREWQDARLSAENMLTFRTKLLNVFADSSPHEWISPQLARDISRPLDIGAVKGRPDAMVAIDLSESDDFSAVTAGLYDAALKGYRFHTAYFFPRGALKGHPNERLYRLWAEKGYLRLTGGPVIDYRAIVEYVLHLNRHLRILSIGYDAWKSQEAVNMLAAAGAGPVLKSVSQTYGNFTAPVESFEHGAKTGRIFIDDNPINAYCFGNAVLDYDRLENCKPVKRSRYQKIDGVVTMLMCLRLFIDYER